MRKSRRPIVIAARPSKLARAQTEAIGRVLGRLHSHVKVEYRWIESEGDVMPDQSLADAGGKGMFTRAVERALLREEADLAVHSLKDLPTQLTPGLTIAAIPRRADPRDCLISPDAATINDLRHGAIVGTASPRRSAQLLRLRPDLEIRLLRGNVETRLNKVLQSRQVDATLLAIAGLSRCGLAEYAGKPIDPDILLPAAAQGALAVQCRVDDHLSITRCLPLNDAATSAAVHCERAVIDGLAGNCHSAIAAYAQPLDPESRTYRVRVRVLSADGERILEEQAEAKAQDLTHVAEKMVQSLRDRGAMQLLMVVTPPQRATVS